MNKLFKNTLLAVALAASALLASAIAPQKAQALDYTVALTTYVPTASATDYGLGSYPNISGNLYVRDLWIANAGATAQDISIYDSCTSSMTAVLVGKFSLAAAIGTVNIGQFLPKSLLLTSPCFTKSATASSVQLNVYYE